ncbi:hypothetical protein ACQP2E_15885 [Actinoplanes sp. CA-015351]|uniref:hypothetical protein n=1 Tax=Actinoplanes sp. CA-015351 TaxID=3239897 RepID=UPI003D99372D
MPDVMNLLRDLPRADGPADPALVAADVTRGHLAVRRRRQQRLGFTAAAVVAVAALSAGAFSVRSAGPEDAGPGASASALHLVAWTGGQPVGFEVAVVPQGWTIVSSTPYEFVVAPPGKETGVGPSAAPDQVFYDQRIAVYFTGGQGGPQDPAAQTVDINGREAKLGRFPAFPGTPPARWLIFPSDKGSVTVQVPDSTGLSTDQIVGFVRGITVTGS